MHLSLYVVDVRKKRGKRVPERIRVLWCPLPVLVNAVSFHTSSGQRFRGIHLFFVLLFGGSQVKKERKTKRS